MKTILILAVCISGTLSVLYAAATCGASVRPASPSADLGKIGTLNINLGDLAHQFSAINVTLAECDFTQ